MRVTVGILLALSVLALGKIEKVRMPRDLCMHYTNLGKQYKARGNTRTQHEIQDLALKQYLWSTEKDRPHTKIPEATTNWIESLDREIYNVGSQGRQKRQAGWYRGERKEIRMLSDAERRELFDCFQTLKDTTVSENKYHIKTLVSTGFSFEILKYIFSTS
jgi:hypothetical protein